MDNRNYLTCLWPGLPELWWRGRLSALPLAVGFAIGLNALLLLRFIYPYWLDPFLVRAACWLGLIGWAVWTIKSFKELPALLAPRAVTEEPDRFAEAQIEYLRARWDQAESLLLGILSIEPRDPPALLLLSGVYRHTQRVDSASLLMEELRRLEISDTWQIEIDAELSRIQRALESKNHPKGSELAGADGTSDEPSDRPSRESSPGSSENNPLAADMTAA